MQTLLLSHHYNGTFVNFWVNIHILVHVHLMCQTSHVDGHILLLHEGIQFWIQVGGLKSDLTMAKLTWTEDQFTNTFTTKKFSLPTQEWNNHNRVLTKNQEHFFICYCPINHSNYTGRRHHGARIMIYFYHGHCKDDKPNNYNKVNNSY